jgi:hypothetical protein
MATPGLFSKRLPHVLTRADMTMLLVPTYAARRDVEDDEAAERLARALAAPGVLDDLYRGLSAGLAQALGPRTTEDALVDRLSKGVATRRGKVRPAPDTPAIAAVLVRLDVEVGLVADAMRATLETPRGRAILEEGLRALGTHLVKELVR